MTHLRLQPRDLDVLTFLSRNRYATDRQLHRLYFNHGTVQYGYRRLLKLRQEGYTQHLRVPGLALNPQKGRAVNSSISSQTVIYLSKKGAATLALGDTETKPAVIPPTPDTPNKAYLLLHDLAVTDHLVDVLVAVERHQGTQEPTYFTQWELADRTRDTLESRQPLPVPDLYFSFVDEGGKRLHWFLEYDRSYANMKKWRQKFERYEMASENRAFHELLSIPHFRLLVKTTGHQRVRNLIQLLDEVVDNRSRRLFWFSPANREPVAGGEDVFTAEWLLPSGLKRTLI